MMCEMQSWNFPLVLDFYRSQRMISKWDIFETLLLANLPVAWGRWLQEFKENAQNQRAKRFSMVSDRITLLVDNKKMANFLLAETR